MARRTLNRKELREANDAAEAQGMEEDDVLEDGDEESVGKKKPAKKPAAKRKTKAKAAVEARMKLYWGVFSQNAKRVALFEFDQKDEAVQKAEELSKGGKSPHFVQKVKEQIAD